MSKKQSDMEVFKAAKSRKQEESDQDEDDDWGDTTTATTAQFKLNAPNSYAAPAGG